MTYSERALGQSPNPSGWRKVDATRVGYALMAQGATLGTHSRSEIWAVAKRALHCMKINGTAQLILETLVFRTFEDDWKAGARPIVWQQNAALARAAGLAISNNTVRSALSTLAAHGLITYQDSANCRRAGSRGSDGVVKWAYGIDLSILAARYEELRILAEAHEAEHAQWVECRTAVHKMRRQIPAHCQSAIAQDLAGRWSQFKARYEWISRIVGRSHKAPLKLLQRARRAYATLLRLIQNAMLSNAQNEYNDATASEIGCLLETTTQPHSVSCNDERHRANARSVNSHTDNGSAVERMAFENYGGEKGDVEHKSHAPSAKIFIQTVVNACPEMLDYGKIDGWRDLVDLAGQLRGSLGISPDAWREARAAMGAVPAAIALAIIVQKSAAGLVREPGAYLRGMTGKVAGGDLHLEKTLHGLIAEQESQRYPNGHVAGAFTARGAAPWRPAAIPRLL
ncbi:plasmid replication protein RepC (plasmid) [Agrobacterium rosae]|uniref:Plasmid replication protein RepC n=1 Tax=Agrobacterium rosae TaxID=1972867 RepID=A0ABU4W4J0_9HYPH|nr:MULTISPECIES: plasmid replication protein RepC [Agrobacterium]MDX8311698.1 plasmid replication protein RepC [Agrobacterium sp. rho-13.3]MDX8332694.1 plasmid replication protein RepC [Agrobacterium rosae]